MGSFSGLTVVFLRFPGVAVAMADAITGVAEGSVEDPPYPDAPCDWHRTAEKRPGVVPGRVGSPMEVPWPSCLGTRFLCRNTRLRACESDPTAQQGENLTLEELEDQLLLQKVLVKQLKADYEQRATDEVKEKTNQSCG